MLHDVYNVYLMLLLFLYYWPVFNYFSGSDKATAALDAVNGTILKGKPIIIQYGKLQHWQLNTIIWNTSILMKWYN